MADKDPEKQRPERIPWFKMVMDQGVVTEDIINHPYAGSGTEEDPYIVEWLEDDPRNPMLWPQWIKWSLTQLVAISTLAVSFVSSAYSGGISQILMEFRTTSEIATLGISLFVVGFAIGPLLWGPMSELYGRQYLYMGTIGALTVFNAGACGAQNITTLVVLRFLAGAFGASPLTNAGGVIADMFSAAQRGLATTLFASAPFLGPSLGPIVGGFVGETIGWRWLEGIMAIFTGIFWIAGSLLVPETYPPVLLRQRAKRLTKLSNGEKIYRSRTDAEQGVVTAGKAFKTALSRPWILLFREPIVLILTIYMAIVYGTLYMFFAAYPIVFQETRGWSQGIGGLPFLGIAVGMMFAIAYAVIDNKRYAKLCDKDPGGIAPPEARLPPSAVGGIAIPIGLFWFAWTNYTSIHYMVCISAGVPFGFGMVLVFLSVMNYLIDSYTIFAASVMAANSVLRSLFGAVFPLFTAYMYEGLGNQWASSVPAFLALACTPFPFLFMKYGPAIRVRCKYAAEAKVFMDKLRGVHEEEEEEGEKGDDPPSSGSSAVNRDKKEQATGTEKKESYESSDSSDSANKEKRRQEEREQEAIDTTHEEVQRPRDGSDASAAAETRFHPIRTAAATEGDRNALRQTRSRASSMRSAVSKASTTYESSPWDIDRVNTRESFPGEQRPGSGKKPRSPWSKGAR